MVSAEATIIIYLLLILENAVTRVFRACWQCGSDTLPACIKGV